MMMPIKSLCEESAARTASGTGSIWRRKTTSLHRLRDFGSSILERIDGIAGWIVFHGNKPVVAKIRKFTINSRVVYLASTWFVPSRDIGDVNKPDLIDVVDEFLNQITEPALLMIEVIQDLHIRPADLPNDLESVGYGLQERSWDFQAHQSVQ